MVVLAGNLSYCLFPIKPPWLALPYEEGGSVPEHAMQYHRQLAGQCNTRLSGTRQRPTLQIRTLHGARQDDVGRLVERGSHAHVADLRDAAAIIGLTRLVFLRRQSDVRPDRS